MPKVKRIGCEFFGSDSSNGVETSFPKLETLDFGSMDNLEECDLNTKDVMPRLKHLAVRDCPMLKRIILALGNLEFLETFMFWGLNEWEDWEMMIWKEITIMPCLLELSLDKCYKLKSVPECSTIKKLTIRYCPKLTQSCLPPLLETLELLCDASDLLKEMLANNG
ncbi:hypothetical protein GIB67_017079 [Kingdonia uniflora]|uniref:Uncharacterized protein n=1 Tax=Kingdonia uniflora TaxID=39325 RepID=A0A7J7NCI0_9MAGN|nr:hypothetical protein GIB67_017079 [Kingdonia uniflora]